MIDNKEHDVVTIGSERSFGLVFATVFAVLGVWPLIDGAGTRWWALAVALLFAIIALLAPAVLAPLNRIWFQFGVLLGRIVGPVVMALIFFLAVTPTALIFRFRRKDLLHLARQPNAKSYWITRDETVSGSMRDQF